MDYTMFHDSQASKLIFTGQRKLLMIAHIACHRKIQAIRSALKSSIAEGDIFHPVYHIDIGSAAHRLIIGRTGTGERHICLRIAKITYGRVGGQVKIST